MHKRLIAHGVRDLCCFHLHKEAEAIHSLKLYGMDQVKLPSSSSAKEDALPSSLDEMDSFIEQATNNSSPISFANRSEKAFHSSGEEESVDSPLSRPVVRSLREEGKPYNSILACEIDEVTPQRGEVG